MKRKSAKVVEIKEPILPPKLISVEESARRTEPKEKRVSLVEEVLMRKLMSLFKEQESWKVEEMANELDHPRDPIAKMLKQIGDFDQFTRKYSLKASYR